MPKPTARTSAKGRLHCLLICQGARSMSISPCSMTRLSGPRLPQSRSASRRSISLRATRRLTVGRRRFCYAANHLIDVENAVIVDVEASTAVRQADVTAAKRMTERSPDRHGLWPRKLIADTGYGSAEMLAWLVHERGIEPHVPVFDKSARADDAFDRGSFRFDREQDRYTCPAGKQLRPFRRTGYVDHERPSADGFFRYRASKLDCDACPLKPHCCHAPSRAR